MEVRRGSFAPIVTPNRSSLVATTRPCALTRCHTIRTSQRCHSEETESIPERHSVGTTVKVQTFALFAYQPTVAKKLGLTAD